MVAPLPVDEITALMSERHHAVIVEEIAGCSGIRQDLAWQMQHKLPDCKVDGIDLGHQFVTHGDLNTLYKHYGLDAQSIADYTKEVLGI